jgi:hypothetical protein
VIEVLLFFEPMLKPNAKITNPRNKSMPSQMVSVTFSAIHRSDIHCPNRDYMYLPFTFVPTDAPSLYSYSYIKQNIVKHNIAPNTRQQQAKTQGPMYGVGPLVLVCCAGTELLGLFRTPGTPDL